jgi:hypothetical protein
MSTQKRFVRWWTLLAGTLCVFLIACGEDPTGPLWGARVFNLQHVNGAQLPTEYYRDSNVAVDIVRSELRVISDTLLSELLFLGCSDRQPVGNTGTCIADPNVGSQRLLRYEASQDGVRIIASCGTNVRPNTCVHPVSSWPDSLAITFGARRFLYRRTR